MAVKWSHLDRDSDIILAVWPKYEPRCCKWHLEELYEKDGYPPKWRRRLVPGPHDLVFSDTYNDYQNALEAMDRLNAKYAERLLASNYHNKNSLKIKVDKALTCKRRLRDEEEMMLISAKKRYNKETKKEPEVEFEDEEDNEYRNQIIEQLREMPYLKSMLIHTADYYCRGIRKNMDGKWSPSFDVTKRGAELIERAKIADAFDLNPFDNWRKTKAKIREILLPDATALLLQSDVRSMLDEALMKGDKVLVCSNVVFWYEEDDDNLGWKVMFRSDSSSDDGRTIWYDGKIISKNYGRIVVLPYIKENGEKVLGHTKNVAHDGPAMPRKKENYIELPFKELNGDLMVGLWGEIYHKGYIGQAR